MVLAVRLWLALAGAPPALLGAPQPGLTGASELPSSTSSSTALVVRVMATEAGEVAANALVVIDCSCLAEPLEGFTGADGMLRFEALPRGRYVVQALWRDFEVSRQLELDGRAQVDLRMNGVVGDPTREPVHPLGTGQRCGPGQVCGGGGSVGLRELGGELAISPASALAPAASQRFEGFCVDDPLARASPLLGAPLLGLEGLPGSGGGAGSGAGGPGLALDVAALGLLGGVTIARSRPRAKAGWTASFGVRGRMSLGAPAWPETDEAVVALANRDLAGRGELLAAGPLFGDRVGLVVGVTGQGERLRLSERFSGRGLPSSTRHFPLRAASLGALVGVDWAITARQELSLTAAGGPRWHEANYRLPLDWEPTPFGTNPAADATTLLSTRLGDGPVDEHFGWDRAFRGLTGLRYKARLLDGSLGVMASVSYRGSFAQRGWSLDDPWIAASPRTELQDGGGRDLRAFLSPTGATRWLPTALDEYCAGLRCPLRRGSRGGMGLAGRDRADQVSARVRFQHFFEAFGSHRVAWGLDVDWLRQRSRLVHSGSNGADFLGHGCDDTESPLGEACWSLLDERYHVRDSARVDNHRGLLIDPGPGEPPNVALSRGFGVRRREQGETAAVASAQGHGVRVDGYAGALTRTDYRLIIDERWSPLPSVMIQGGATWMVTDLRDVEGLAEPLVLSRQFAPRIGGAYDWTGRGDSRLYLSYRWDLRPLPLHVAARAVAGVIEVGRWLPEACQASEGGGPVEDERGAPSEWCRDSALYTAASEGAGARPELRGAHDRQLEAGYVQRVGERVDVHLRWVHRALGRTVKTVAGVDGAGSSSDAVFLANPGEGPSGGAARSLPRARRTLDAWSVALERRPEDGLGVHGWAVYSFARLVGNDEGWVDPRTGSRSLETTLRFERPELLINAYGPLAGVPPHRLELGLSHAFGLGPRGGRLSVGGAFHLRSGIPVDVRVDFGDPRYRGRNLVHVLPRGAGGRTPTVARLDLAVGYAIELPRVTLSLEAQVINVANTRAALRVDEVYSFDAIRPIRGGTVADAVHSKTLSSGSNPLQVVRELATRNPNYGVATRFQQPIAAQLGLTLEF